jgi:pimeloyl-ACP methyl ester carboxylesterase
MRRARLKIGAFAFLFFWATFSGAVDVVKTEIKGQGFVGDFYCRPDATNRPGVLVLGGSEGGKPHGALKEFFAENGYPTLALAYFKERGLQQSLQCIPLEYFDKPIAWLESNGRVAGHGIVVFGASRGAELALLLASIHPNIKGVIALSPSSVVWNGMPKEPPVTVCSSWTLDDRPIPFMPYDSSRDPTKGIGSEITPAVQRVFYQFFVDELARTDAVAKAAIRVEQIHGPILLASGDDDTIWPAGEMADAICSRLKKNEFKYQYENLKYPDAGHSLDERWMIGGTPEGNRKARVEFSAKAVSFLLAIEQQKDFLTEGN